MTIALQNEISNFQNFGEYLVVVPKSGRKTLAITIVQHTIFDTSPLGFFMTIHEAKWTASLVTIQ